MAKISEKAKPRKAMIKDFKILAPGLVLVKGQTGDYLQDRFQRTCACKAFEFNPNVPCKHISDMDRVEAAGTRYGFAALDLKLQDQNEAVAELASLAIRYRTAHLASLLGTTRAAVRNAYVFW